MLRQKDKINNWVQYPFVFLWIGGGIVLYHYDVHFLLSATIPFAILFIILQIWKAFIRQNNARFLSYGNSNIRNAVMHAIAKSKPINEISSEFGIPANDIEQWASLVISKSALIFKDSNINSYNQDNVYVGDIVERSIDKFFDGVKEQHRTDLTDSLPESTKYDLYKTGKSLENDPILNKKLTDEDKFEDAYFMTLGSLAPSVIVQDFKARKFLSDEQKLYYGAKALAFQNQNTAVAKEAKVSIELLHWWTKQIPIGIDYCLGL